MVFTVSEIHLCWKCILTYFKWIAFQLLSLLKINVKTWKVNIVWIIEIVLHLSFERLYILRLSIKRESNFLSWIINGRVIKENDQRHKPCILGLFCYCYVMILSKTFNLSELTFCIYWKMITVHDLTHS